MQQIRIAVCLSRAHSRFFEPLANALENHGCHVEMFNDGNDRALNFDILLLVGSVGSFRKFRKKLQVRTRYNAKVVAWNWEPLPPRSLELWAEKLAWGVSASRYGLNLSRFFVFALTLPVFMTISRSGLGRFSNQGVPAASIRYCTETFAFIKSAFSEGWISAIAVSTMQRVQFLKSRGISSVFVPVGQQEEFGENLNLDRTDDVVFVGKTKNKPRRQRQLKLLTESLAERGLRLKVYSHGLYGDERTQALNKARILVHFHNFPWDSPWMRWSLASACGCAIVSQPIDVPEPLSPGIHYLEAELDEMADCIADLVSNEEKRKKIAKDCGEFIKATMHLEGSVSRLMAVFEDVLVHGKSNPNG